MELTASLEKNSENYILIAGKFDYPNPSSLICFSLLVYISITPVRQQIVNGNYFHLIKKRLGLSSGRIEQAKM